jgi:NADH:ubiquinone oxidoreductase subunit H
MSTVAVIVIVVVVLFLLAMLVAGGRRAATARAQARLSPGDEGYPYRSHAEASRHGDDEKS